MKCSPGSFRGTSSFGFLLEALIVFLVGLFYANFIVAALGFAAAAGGGFEEFPHFDGLSMVISNICRVGMGWWQMRLQGKVGSVVDT